MTFGIDFDGTFTALPMEVSGFIKQLESGGHRVLIVTARRDTEENLSHVREYLKEWGCVLPIVFSSLGSKLDAVAKRGIEVDVWMDDDPVSLVNGH